MGFLWIFVLPQGEELTLHSHSPQEIYITLQVEGLLLSSVNTKIVCKDRFVYISKNLEHGIKNWCEGFRNIKFPTLALSGTNISFKGAALLLTITFGPLSSKTRPTCILINKTATKIFQKEKTP